jgi:serine/threonine-protein kinase
MGRGGMGIVYRARQIALNRVVALKMLRDGLATNAGDRARFRSEAEAISRLRHPNIVQIYEVGECHSQPFLALEFIDGGALDQFIAGQPLPPRLASSLVETLARAVHYAHIQGVVHRDLKSANVLLANGRHETAGARP